MKSGKNIDQKRMNFELYEELKLYKLHGKESKVKIYMITYLLIKLVFYVGHSISFETFLVVTFKIVIDS